MMFDEFKKNNLFCSANQTVGRIEPTEGSWTVARLNIHFTIVFSFFFNL